MPSKHRHQKSLKFLDHEHATVAKEADVSNYFTLNNHATYKTPAVKRWLLRHPAYHLHFIPTSSSWLNQVEQFFTEITEKKAFAVHHSKVLRLSNEPSSTTSPLTTPTRNRSLGSRMLMTSSTQSKRFANGLPTQENRLFLATVVSCARRGKEYFGVAFTPDGAVRLP
jgi:hypothetical protein